MVLKDCKNKKIICSEFSKTVIADSFLPCFLPSLPPPYPPSFHPSFLPHPILPSFSLPPLVPSLNIVLKALQVSSA